MITCATEFKALRFQILTFRNADYNVFKYCIPKSIGLCISILATELFIMWPKFVMTTTQVTFIVCC